MLKKFFFSKLFILACLAVAALIGAGIGRNYLRKQQVNKEVSQLKGEISRLEQGNQELSKLIDYLQTSNFIEEQAKTKFGLAREGESVMVVTPPDKIQTKSDHLNGPLAAGQGADLSNYQRWWYYFWK